MGIDPGDGHIAADDGVGHGSPVPDEQDKFRMRIEAGHILDVAEHQGVLVAEEGGYRAMAEDNGVDERACGLVQQLHVDPCLLQATVLLAGTVPAVPHGENPRNDASFFPTSDFWVCIQHGSDQGGATSRNTTYEYYLAVFQ